MSKIKIIDSDNRQTECDISAEKDLSDLLYHLLNQDLRVVILEIMNVGIVTLGVGQPYGFVQYSRNMEPPYLFALNDAKNQENNSVDEIEFDSGGTLTPIPIRQCLPYDRIVQIVIYLFKNNELPQYVKWEEI